MFRGSESGKGDLRSATLNNTDFSGADLSHADLHDCEIEHGSEPNFTGAKLHQANLEGLELYKAKFVSADLRRANLSRAVVSSCDFSKADLRAANFKGAVMHDVAVDDALLYRIDFSQAETLSLRKPKGHPPRFDGSTRWPLGSTTPLMAIKWSSEFWIFFMVALVTYVSLSFIAWIVSLFRSSESSGWNWYLIVVAAMAGLGVILFRLFARFGRSASYEVLTGFDGEQIAGGGFWDTGRAGTYIDLRRSSLTAGEMLTWLQHRDFKQQRQPIEIDASYTEFADEHLRYLSDALPINSLDVSCTKASAQGIEEFQRVQPDCHVKTNNEPDS